VEAYNCVFHALARAHPEVCRFDLAFMEAASGRPVQHLECLVRGGHACRFRLGSPKPGDPAPDPPR
jgi:predicted ArsR family transcriptional regulator